jgi:hypothetical protein
MKFSNMLVTWLAALVATSAWALDILQVDWDNKELVSAREAKVDLLSTGNGFEGSGASELASTKLPVIGVLPSQLGAVFAAASSGFESAPKVSNNFRTSGLKLIAAALPNKLEYSISYQHIADGLDAFCVGKRTVNTARVPLPAEAAQMLAKSAEVENDDEVHAAHAQQSRYGLPYRCDVYCSDAKTYPYCKNNAYAVRMLEKAVLLTPGIRD